MLARDPEMQGQFAAAHQCRRNGLAAVALRASGVICVSVMGFASQVRPPARGETYTKWLMSHALSGLGDRRAALEHPVSERCRRPSEEARGAVGLGARLVS